MVAYKQSRKRTVLYSYDKIWLHYFYLPRKFYKRKCHVRTEGIQLTLYFIMRSIYLVNYCCFYEYIACINSTVNVKQKQT